MNPDERMYIVDNQKVTVGREINGERILDIGGGGEGIIGLCYGKKVVAIDPRKDELEEAPDGPQKIVMDARELSFSNNYFDAVTSFFTLMYIKEAEHEKVFNEVYRVLKNDGEFILWDAEIPEYDDSGRDIFVVKLEIDTPDKQIRTGYGTLRKDREQDIKYFKNMGLTIGFKVVKEEQNDKVFKLVFRK